MKDAELRNLLLSASVSELALMRTQGWDLAEAGAALKDHLHEIIDNIVADALAVLQ